VVAGARREVAVNASPGASCCRLGINNRDGEDEGFSETSSDPERFGELLGVPWPRLDLTGESMRRIGVCPVGDVGDWHVFAALERPIAPGLPLVQAWYARWAWMPQEDPSTRLERGASGSGVRF
jgi:hypothetical protein